ncbi:MAG: ImmA/IrrE family metallo-endopeptidase [Flavobacteriaceae bacterium]
MKKVEEITSKLLKNLNLKTLPIKPEKIADKLGIKYAITDLGNNVSGVLMIENDKAKIGLNKSEGELRRRFTFAHEIGHYMLHKNSENKLFVDDLKVLFRKSNVSRKEMMQEREANAFAASLLMPFDLIEKKFNKLLYSDNNLDEEAIIEKLAKKFKVSIMAMSYRLINLGFINHRNY